MIRLTRRVFGVLACATAVTVLVIARTSTDEDMYWPVGPWRLSSPETQGMNSAVLADALEYIQAHRTRIHSLTIVRNGYVVLDATFWPFQENSVHDLASATKSVTTTLIGIAIGDGNLRDVQQPVLSVFAGRPVDHRDDRKEHVTVEHLLTMTSGLDCEYQGGERTLREMRASSDWVQFMLDRPVMAVPGTKGEYCSGGMHLLSGVVSHVTGTSALEYARHRLFQPLGIEEVVWPADAQGITHGWGDLHLRPHDMAKIGYLWLNHGRWKDQQIVPAEWMAAAISPYTRVLDHEYGYGLWLNVSGDPMLFEANGRGGQRITVVPSKRLVLAITGGAFEPGDLAPYIWKAIQSDAPLPANAVAGRRLAALIDAARRPPPGDPPPPMPAMSRHISARRYVLESNPMGWRAIAFTFSRADTATVHLEFSDGRVEERPISLDNIPRISQNGRFGLRVAVQGRWTGPSTFVFDYDEVANINAFVCRFIFDDQTAVVDVKERSGEVDIRIRATRAG